ncbi:MAG: Gfo/Idh/MocA family oxidoreductase [Planctomycetes bacterium]|nr:Gfo/Idh/MocA family oxidoreductase [Planctomycetota bacterium]
MINVGIAGIGFMGWIHWLAYQKVPAAKVSAIWSRDEKKRRGDWTGIKGNFGPEGTQVDLTGIAAHAELDQLLADQNVDLVDLCLPPHMHVETCLKSLEAGKHVLVEKPLALTTKDCDRIVGAADSAGKQVFVGHVLPFFPEYAHARKLIDDGSHGNVLGGTFKRVISDPSSQWLPDFFDPDRIGGPMVDLHVHDAHLIRLLFGMPTEVVANGRLRGDVVEYCQSLFRFDDPQLTVCAVCGVINQQGRSFTHGFEIHLEGATLQFEFAVFADGSTDVMPLKVLTDDGQVVRPDLGDGDPVNGFVAEIEEVVRCVESGNPSQILGGDLARDAILLCHKQTESVKQAKPISV